MSKSCHAGSGDSESPVICPLCNMIITRIYALNRIHVSVGHTVVRKNRENSALSIKTKGKTVYFTEKKEWISDPDHIVFLPKGTSYDWKCLEEGECLMLEFDCENAPAQIERIPVKNCQELAAIFSRLESLMLFKPHGYFPKCMAGVYEILFHIAESGHMDYQYSSKKERIRPSIEYMEQHYSDSEIDNTMLARLSGISVVYFRKIFAELYGTSPIRYLNMIKIEKAKGLLLSDYGTIENVAQSVGYTNVYHFCKMFKQLTGMSPGRYASLGGARNKADKSN